MSERLFYTIPARVWEESLPIGNGSIGAMIFGDPKSERVALNHDTLWSGHPCQHKRPGAAESIRRTAELTLQRRYVEACQEAEANALCQWTELYMPAGDLWIEFPETAVSDYSRSLDLSRAVAATSFRANEALCTREAFVSYPDNAVIYRLSADRPGQITCNLRLDCQLRSTVSTTGDALVLDAECPYEMGILRNVKDWSIPYLYGENGDHGIRYRCAVRVLAEGGTVTYTDDRIELCGCDSATVLCCIATSFVDYKSIPDAEYQQAALDLLQKAEKPYAALLEAHVADYQALYNRVSLDVGSDPAREALPTFERLQKHAEDQGDPGLYSLLFQYGRYLTIAGSRPGSQAMNLQGIWNHHLRAPWNSNYTININTEMNYWPTLPANLAECTAPLHDLLRRIADTGRETAKHFYNASGWVCHHNTDIWGFSVPTLLSASWALWNGSSGWLSRHLHEYWRYTGDDAFLTETAYPICKEAAVFYLSQLRTNDEGYLILCPGTSPENIFLFEGEKSSVAQWTTMSMAIAKELFGFCIEQANHLGVDADFVAELSDALEKMQPFVIGPRGELLEWNEPFEETEPHHRHVSHLYALHPARLITPEKTPELTRACERTLELRGDDGTGWSLGWKINFWARLLDGDHAIKLMDMQLRPVEAFGVGTSGHGGTYPNLLDAHPPFQIDGNFGLTSGVCEMLVQCDGETLRLLPALPSKWQTGSVKGLRAMGGVTVDIEWADGKLTGYTLHGNRSGLRVVYGDTVLEG